MPPRRPAPAWRAPMLTVALLAGPLPAGAAAPVDAEAAPAVGPYNDTVLAIGRGLGRRLRRVSDQLLLDDSGPEPLLAALRAEIDAATAQAAAMPPFQGDPALRDALAASLVAMERLVDQDLAALATMVADPTPRPDDLARLEASWVHLQDQAVAIDADLVAAQAAFAARHAMAIMPSPPEPPTWSNFEAPGYPPPGSRLPGQFHVLVAVRFANHAQELGHTLTGAVDAYVNAINTQVDMEARRAEALAVARDVLARAEALGPQGGTPRVRDALVAFARTSATWLDGPGAELVALLAGPLLTQEQVDRVNARVDELNRTFLAPQAEVRAAHEAAVRAIPHQAYAAWFAQAQAAARARLGEAVSPTPAPAPPAPRPR